MTSEQKTANGQTGTRRSIRRYGNRCLRRRCRPVDFSAPETRELVRDMWRILAADTGVGLAAPQVGKDLRVILVKDPEASADAGRITLINPEVVETFGPDRVFEEGCLSFPGLYADVVRPAGVVVNYTDEGGHSRQVRNQGMFARIVQHEIDHLDGVLFVDHLSWGKKFLLGPRLLLQLLGHLVWKLRSGK